MFDDTSYRCPACASYETRVAEDEATVYCRRCGATSRVSRLRLRFGQEYVRLGWAAFFSVLIWLNAVVFLVGLVATRDIKALWLRVDDYATVEGVVVSAAPRYVPGGRYSRSGYVADIFYEYTLAGQRYRSDQVHFTSVGREYADAMAYVQKYPVGARVRVYYLPGEPSFAVLEPERNDGVVGGAIFGAVFAVAGLLPIGGAMAYALLRGPTRR